MTTTQTMNLAREQLLKVAEGYRNQGYEVAFHPTPEDVPVFLKNYRPDMIVRRGDESIVVQINSASSLNSSSTQYLSSLAEVVEKQQGWRLEFVMINPEDAPISLPQSDGSLQIQDIEARLSVAKQITTQNLESAVLYSWALVEATLRLLAEKEELSLKNFNPQYLVKYLTYEGVISRSDYQLLMNALSLRNTIAHGFKTSQLTDNSVHELIAATEKLLLELSEPLVVS
jgi:uncharacterized protein YutE (UPF0331/DUF86 family)